MGMSPGHGERPPIEGVVSATRRQRKRRLSTVTRQGAKVSRGGCLPPGGFLQPCGCWPDASDQGREAYARECFAFRCLSRIKPKTKPEAVAVFRYLADSEHMDDTETESILLNLIG